MFNVAEATAAWAKQENLSYELLESVESTNTYLKSKLTSDLKSPHMVVAKTQTKGRGRGTNSWTSPKEGDGLLCSVAFKLEAPPQPIATPCFGWAVHRALVEAFGIDFSLKAPNDIYFDDNKIAGILLESTSQGDIHHLILGLGVNVFSHPGVENSGSILSCLSQGVVEENQWEQFLSHLIPLSSQAALASKQSEISEAIISELDLALKKFSHNFIDEVLNDGSLKLKDGSIINWRDL